MPSRRRRANRSETSGNLGGQALMESIRLRVLVALLPVVAVACSGSGGGRGGGGNRDPLPILITASAIVDVNADGRKDMIIGSQGGGFASPIVLFNNGDGSFRKSTTVIPAQYLGVDGAAV